jgi:hypothetical protein
MKTTLKTASTATVRAIKAIGTTLRRWWAWHQMRSVEIALHDAYVTLDLISDPDVWCAAQANIRLLSRELCRTRAHYQSFLPNGQRIVWDIC